MKNPKATSIYKNCQWPDKVCKPIGAFRQRARLSAKGDVSPFQCPASPNDNEKSES